MLKKTTLKQINEQFNIHYPHFIILQNNYKTILLY